MKKTKMLLSPTFFLDDPLDFEYKQYILLDYLQKVDKGFKALNLADFLYEVRFHSRNIECFLTVKSLLELKNIPEPTQAQHEQFKKITSLPDDHIDLVEAIKTAKWSFKKLQTAVKAGSEAFKRIESNINLYYVGKPQDKNEGYLLVRYAGSPVFECYKFMYDPIFKDVTFTLYKYYDMPGKSDFGDVKNKVLKDENKADDMFIAVESILSYDTRKSLFPVLDYMFATTVYKKNVLGISF
jgi:hypothetical protein